jgi:hypothetical protein
MDLKSERTDRVEKIFWERFVDTIYDSLDYEKPMDAKDLEKALIQKRWGIPKISAINKAINNDLKDKVSKVGKSKWIKIKFECP